MVGCRGRSGRRRSPPESRADAGARRVFSASHRPAHPDDEGTGFDVFDPQGRYLGFIRSPVSFGYPAPVFQGDKVYGVTYGDLGVPYVVVLRIVRSHEDDGDLAPGGAESNVMRHFVAVHVWHLDVQQDHARGGDHLAIGCKRQRIDLERLGLERAEDAPEPHQHVRDREKRLSPQPRGVRDLARSERLQALVRLHRPLDQRRRSALEDRLDGQFGDLAEPTLLNVNALRTNLEARLAEYERQVNDAVNSDPDALDGLLERQNLPRRIASRIIRP